VAAAPALLESASTARLKKKGEASPAVLDLHVGQRRLGFFAGSWRLCPAGYGRVFQHRQGLHASTQLTVCSSWPHATACGSKFTIQQGAMGTASQAGSQDQQDEHPHQPPRQLRLPGRQPQHV
jgi:hypothetical protein